jgi:ABC-2 type transport system ATP-binding protein
VVINDGSIKFDGSLAEVIDNFSSTRLVRLRLAEGQSAEGIEAIADVVSIELPKVTVRCPRTSVAKVLAQVLDRFQIEDVNVEDPPLEEVISKLFHDTRSEASSADSNVTEAKQ